MHAGADGACPDYGSSYDHCPPGCASGTCVYAAKPQCDTDGDLDEPIIAIDGEGGPESFDGGYDVGSYFYESMRKD